MLRVAALRVLALRDLDQFLEQIAVAFEYAAGLLLEVELHVGTAYFPQYEPATIQDTRPLGAGHGLHALALETERPARGEGLAQPQPDFGVLVVREIEVVERDLGEADAEFGIRQLRLGDRTFRERRALRLQLRDDRIEFEGALLRFRQRQRGAGLNAVRDGREARQCNADVRRQSRRDVRR
jgi:hypothetical protein